MVYKLAVAYCVGTALASPDCHTFDSCDDCASAHTWSGGNCRFCLKDEKCHAAGSFFDPCGKDTIVTEAEQCPGVAPSPPPVPPTPSRTDGELLKILEMLFAKLHITDVDLAACSHDESGAFQSLKDFAGDFESGLYPAAAKDLSRAISSASNAMSSCNVPEVQQKLDVFAKSIRWANISTRGIDHVVEVLVDSSDLWKGLEALATSVSGGDFSDMGEKLAALLDKWTAVTGGCSSDNKECMLIDGMLRVLSVLGVQVDGCEAALAPAITEFVSGTTAFGDKNYTGTLQKFATALDLVAVATLQDSCGLKPIGDAISKLSPKLAKAVVTVEESGAVKILVGSADVYNELYGMTMDLKRGDYAAVGLHLGALLAKLRSSGCETQMCIVLEGLLASMQISFTDLEECSSDFQDEWANMQSFLSALEAKKWGTAVSSLGDVFGGFSSSVKDCGTPELAQVLEDTATRLKKDAVATVIGKVAQVLVSGADVSDDLQKVIVDAQGHNWAALGRDLGGLGDWVSGTGCNSFVCRILEGIMQQAELALVDLEPCRSSLRPAEQEFAQGASLWSQGKNMQALQNWAAGLNDVAKSVQACGVAPELAFIEHEAQMLGLGNLTGLEKVSQVIVHGADFYQELYSAVIAIENKDYRSAGKLMGQVMNDMSQWTTGHLCSEPICYVVSGVLQYLAALQNDIGKCKSDFSNTFGNFSAAYHVLVDSSVNSGGAYGGMLQFKHDKAAIKESLLDLSYGIKGIVAGLKDCHLAEFAEILEAVAVKLGVAPEIQFIETLVKILIEGREIENEIADTCSAYATDNWPALGYDLIKLAKTLLELKDADAQVV